MNTAGSNRPTKRARPSGVASKGKADIEAPRPRGIDSLEERARGPGGPRRWYVARVFAGSADLYGATPTEDGLAALSRLSPEEVLALDRDQFAWWGDEDFDVPVHAELGQLKAFLAERWAGPEGSPGPIEEGMVLLSLPAEDGTRFVQFSYQARQAAKRTYRVLLHPGDVKESEAEGEATPEADE